MLAGRGFPDHPALTLGNLSALKNSRRSHLPYQLTNMYSQVGAGGAAVRKQAGAAGPETPAALSQGRALRH